MMGYLILSNILSSLAAKIILIKKFWISWLTEPWPTGWMPIFLSLKYFLILQAMKYYFLGQMRGRTQTTHATQSTLLVPVASSTFSPSTWITFSILTWERRTTQLKYIISMERGRTRGGTNRWTSREEHGRRHGISRGARKVHTIWQCRIAIPFFAPSLI